MLLDSCLQFLQATLPIPLRGTDLLMPGKDLYHPQILILLQQVREHALADRAGIKHTVRERRAERSTLMQNWLKKLVCTIPLLAGTKRKKLNRLLT